MSRYSSTPLANSSQMEQTTFNFEDPYEGQNTAVWTPRDIWVRLDQRGLELFKEDRRVERKGCRNVDLDDLATYYSAFSNTPDGGLIVYGIDNDGTIVGCNSLGQKTHNRIERSHLINCPLARPEFKRVAIVIDGKMDYCLAIYLPYVGMLVETNKGEAWIRYGDSRHKMRDEEKNDFRATRQELSFEMTVAALRYPDDFDLRIIQDFCDRFRQREQRTEWTNRDILIDRHLLRHIDGELKPLNSLVLMAANDPRYLIPGCRVRVQRFESTQEGWGPTYTPVIDRYIEGNLVKIIQETQELLSSIIYDVTWLNDDGKFVTTPEYPRWAWLESLINACVHRSYSFSGTEVTIKLFSDRIEIESPGGFVPPVNEKNIYEMRSSRNPHLMDALRYLGYVQMAREGTRRIRESMTEAHLPEPVFRQEAVHGVVVRVSLLNDHLTRRRATNTDVATFFGVDTWRSLQEHERKIAAYAFRNGQIQVSEAQRLTGRTWGTSKKDLDRLDRAGILIFMPGEYIRDPKARYIIRAKVGDMEPPQGK